MTTQQLNKLAYHAAVLDEMADKMQREVIPVDLERLKAQVEKINKQVEEVV